MGCQIGFGTQRRTSATDEQRGVLPSRPFGCQFAVANNGPLLRSGRSPKPFGQARTRESDISIARLLQAAGLFFIWAWYYDPASSPLNFFPPGAL